MKQRLLNYNHSSRYAIGKSSKTTVLPRFNEKNAKMAMVAQYCLTKTYGGSLAP